MAIQDIDRQDIERAIAWARGRTEQELRAFAGATRGAARWFLALQEESFQLKILMAIAYRLKHDRPIRTRDFTTGEARQVARRAGFDLVGW